VTPLPITGGQFTESFDLVDTPFPLIPFYPYTDSMTINGTFEGTDSASGTYTYERGSDSTTCSGNWNASPL